MQFFYEKSSIKEIFFAKLPEESSLGYKEYTKALLELGNKSEVVKKIPDSKLKAFLNTNKIDRFSPSIETIKKIYKFYLKEGHIKFDLHPLLEKRIIIHLEELKKGVKHSSNYVWDQTGGIPGIHAEILCVNEMLYRIESVMKFKGMIMTDEVFAKMIGYNKNIKKDVVMIRCGDCNFLTYDVPFIEKLLIQTRSAL